MSTTVVPARRRLSEVEPRTMEASAASRPAYRRSHSTSSQRQPPHSAAPSPLHRRKRQRTRHTRSSSSTDGSYDILTTLDLPVPISYQVGELHALLDGSLRDALERLATFRGELSTEYVSSDGSDDALLLRGAYGGSDTEAMDRDSETETETEMEMETDADADEGAHSPLRHKRSPKDIEMLEQFLHEAGLLLESIRDDIHSHLPSLPSRQTLRDCFPTASATVDAVRNQADSQAVLDCLTRNWDKAHDLLQHLSIYSPVGFRLPEMPAAVSSLSTSARESLASSRRRFSVSVSSLSLSPFPSPSLYAAAGVRADEADPASSGQSDRLPAPPVSAVRAFLAAESAKLSNKLPATPTFEGFAEGISHAIHDASHYVHDRGEKLLDFVDDEADKLRKALQNGATRLLHYSELPVQWKNNKFIHGGYRFVPIDRPVELIWGGLTTMHNETINIYTHLLPALYIIWYIFFVFPHTALGDVSTNTIIDRAINMTFLVASLVCLLLSAAWHLASGCGTFAVFHSCATLDYLGISALISSSILTLTHQGFRCAPGVDLTYNTATCLLGALGLYLPWQAWFNQRKNKNKRIAFFLLLAGAGAAPMAHMAGLYGAGNTWYFYRPVLYSLLAYIAGLVMYILDLPECLRPGGTFDILLHSHQFWHCAIVGAIALHWWALTGMSEKGLTGFSCTGRDPHSSQFLMNWFHGGGRDEL